MSPVIKTTVLSLALAVSTGMVTMSVQADANTYGNSPVTVKGYAGDAKTSTSYKGQIARHLLLNSLKKLAGKGNGKPNPELKAKMMSYFEGKDASRIIIDPQTKGDFKIKQTMISDLASKNLKGKAGKTIKGDVASWPGSGSTSDVMAFMIDKASSAKKGFDPLTGYNYPQLISKYGMGAIMYNQAVGYYLTKLDADYKPNNKPYKKGAPYTGKEHVWDEAFGYFGAPAHVMNLKPADAKNIGKKKDIKIADANGDGVVDLYKEMIYSHASYAADADKAGKTNYLKTITKAFIDGRSLISSAKGETLSDAQRAKLKGFADVIKTNWEKVIAEAAFKYAGETYEDLEKLKGIVEKNGDATKAFATYGKHWSEMKGFAMALQTSGAELDIAEKLNSLIGYGPVLLGGNQVTGVDAKGNFTTGGSESLGDYMVHMIKVQKLLDGKFGLKAKQHDATGNMENLMKALGESKSAEND
ncbi:MAG: DUF4856 domain-containing protein [Cocleimonas sp.]|nr:DUF4856 domain-containing protein [Cocleimonas sp.]